MKFTRLRFQICFPPTFCSPASAKSQICANFSSLLPRCCARTMYGGRRLADADSKPNSTNVFHCLLQSRMNFCLTISALEGALIALLVLLNSRLLSPLYGTSVYVQAGSSTILFGCYVLGQLYFTFSFANQITEQALANAALALLVAQLGAHYILNPLHTIFIYVFKRYWIAASVSSLLIHGYVL